MTKAKKTVLDKTFWKFILVGIVNTLFGTGIMFLFYNVFHLSYWISSMSNYFFGSILSYALNRIFTFKNNDNTKRTLPKFIINICLCYFVAYGLAKPLAMKLLAQQTVVIQDNVAMIIGMGIFVIMNYLGQRYFVFR